MEVVGRVRQRDRVHTVFDLPAIAVVLPLDAAGRGTALGGARLVNAANRVGRRELLGNQLLAAITNLFLGPHNAFKESLKSSRRRPKMERHRLDILALDR